MLDNVPEKLFAKSKPVLRHFEPMTQESAGDFPYLWDAYQRGLLVELPSDLDIESFTDYMIGLLDQIPEVWVVEDEVQGEIKPIAFVFCSHDGWIMEPHAVYFDYATPRNILRAYVAFLKKTKWRKDTGACLVRVDQKDRKFVNRIEQMKIGLEWVGKIWGGKPTGNEYLYSMRCSARRH